MIQGLYAYALVVALVPYRLYLLPSARIFIYHSSDHGVLLYTFLWGLVCTVDQVRPWTYPEVPPVTGTMIQAAAHCRYSVLHPSSLGPLRSHGSNAAVNSVVRAFRTSTTRPGQRAVVYSRTGDPSAVLSAVRFPDLPPPAPRTANVRFLLSPINPADINVIEGVYPARPSPSTDLPSDACAVFVAGNEGVAEVLSVGDGVTDLKERDWVVMTKPQMGTWASSRNIRVEDVLKVDSLGLSAAQAATLTVRVFVELATPY